MCSETLKAEILFYNITVNHKKAIFTSICLRFKLNINYIPNDWLYKIKVSHRTEPKTKDYQNGTSESASLRLQLYASVVVPQILCYGVIHYVR